MIQARLHPIAQRLDQKRRGHDGDHRAGGTGRERRVRQLADQRNGREINRHHGAGGKRIGQSALENNVHVHQPVANDGVAEAERNQSQRKDGKLRPLGHRSVEQIRNQVKAQERHDAGQRAARHPLQLLAQNAAGSAEIASQENSRRQQVIRAHVGKFDLVQLLPVGNRRHQVQHRQGHRDVGREECQGDDVNGQQFRPKRPTPLGKYQCEVNEQSGLQHPCDFVGPVDDVVERVQLPAVMEAVENERNQAENVEMHRPRRIPAARKNEQPDEQIQDGRNAQVVFDAERFVLRGRDQRDLEGLVAAPNLILHLRPDAGMVENLGDVDGTANGGRADGLNEIALLNSRSFTGRTRGHIPGCDSRCGIDPRDSIIRGYVLGPLPEIEAGEHHGRKRQQREGYSPKT